MKDHNPSPITRQATGVAGKGGELEALLARVEAATGPDRELDGEVWVALEWTRKNTDPCFYELLDAGEWRAALNLVQPDWPAKDWVPRFTASLDAALALVGRVLPGPDVEVWSFSGRGWGAALTKPDAYRYRVSAHSYSPTPALAVCAATLKALSHQPPRAPDEPGDRAREAGKSLPEGDA